MSQQLLKTFTGFNLKKISYEKAYNLQKTLTNWNIECFEEASPVILFLEHDPVYTVGLRSNVYNKQEENRLRALGSDFFRSDRGGLITFHGPGQLVVYPIFNMRNANLGVKSYVNMLEETVIQLCKKYELKTERSPHTGVWVKDNKICAMGINVQRRVASHGLALNCDINLNWFSHIVACGIHGKGVTSLSNELARQVKVPNILQPFISSFEEVFEWKSSSPVINLDPCLHNDKLFDTIRKSCLSKVAK